MDLTIKILSHQDIDDFVALLSVFEKVFEIPAFVKPDRNYLERILGNPGFLVAVAVANNAIVGGLTAYTLHQYYVEKPLAYIYDLAVLNDFQRKGIGKALISFLTEYCREKGFEEVYVPAHADDDEALDFYRRTNFTKEESVVHFSWVL
ncbi:GNAT family N-acetyltransferase [Chitinophaga sp. RAB17]|uniref:GNAT family N-acetyltransferase n=1 Tax=Chitinophaga sp. RAB17 TaxID=3233049 RepID=UPI003F92A33F